MDYETDYWLLHQWAQSSGTTNEANNFLADSSISSLHSRIKFESGLPPTSSLQVMPFTDDCDNVVESTSNRVFTDSTEALQCSTTDYCSLYNHIARQHDLTRLKDGDFEEIATFPRHSDSASNVGRDEFGIGASKTKHRRLIQRILRKQPLRGDKHKEASLSLKQKRDRSGIANQVKNSRDPISYQSLDDLARLGGIGLLHLPIDFAPVPLALPSFLTASATYLAQHGVTACGIFRVPGSQSIVNAIYNYYSQQIKEAEVDESQIQTTVGCSLLPSHISYGIHDVASVFKRFLIKIPGGLLGSYRLFSILREICDGLVLSPELDTLQHAKVKGRMIALAISCIKCSHRLALICAVFGLLSMIGRATVQNLTEDEIRGNGVSAQLMSHEALGVIFGPVLLGEMSELAEDDAGFPHSESLLVSEAVESSSPVSKRTSGRFGLSFKEKSKRIYERANVAVRISQMLIVLWENITGSLKDLQSIVDGRVLIFTYGSMRRSDRHGVLHRDMGYLEIQGPSLDIPDKGITQETAMLERSTLCLSKLPAQKEAYSYPDAGESICGNELAKSTQALSSQLCHQSVSLSGTEECRTQKSESRADSGRSDFSYGLQFPSTGSMPLQIKRRGGFWDTEIERLGILVDLQLQEPIVNTKTTFENSDEVERLNKENLDRCSIELARAMERALPVWTSTLGQNSLVRAETDSDEYLRLYDISNVSADPMSSDTLMSKDEHERLHQTEVGNIVCTELEGENSVRDEPEHKEEMLYKHAMKPMEVSKKKSMLSLKSIPWRFKSSSKLRTPLATSLSHRQSAEPSSLKVLSSLSCLKISSTKSRDFTKPLAVSEANACGRRAFKGKSDDLSPRQKREQPSFFDIYTDVDIPQRASSLANNGIRYQGSTPTKPSKEFGGSKIGQRDDVTVSCNPFTKSTEPDTMAVRESYKGVQETLLQSQMFDTRKRVSPKRPNESTFNQRSVLDDSPLLSVTHTAGPYATLYAEIQMLKQSLHSKSEEIGKAKQEIEAMREIKDSSALSEKLREIQREAQLWKARAESAERLLLMQQANRDALEMLT